MLSPSRYRRLRQSIVVSPAVVRTLRPLAGSSPAASLQPGECADYTGPGGVTVKCCKGSIFATISCYAIDYPGGRRRRVDY